MPRERFIPSGILRNSDRQTLPVFHYVVRNQKSHVRFRLKPNASHTKYDVILLDLPGTTWTKQSREKNHIFSQSDGTYWVCTKEEFKPTTVKGGTDRAVKFIERIQILLDSGISIDNQYKQKIPADSLLPVSSAKRTRSGIHIYEHIPPGSMATDRVVNIGKVILWTVIVIWLFRACSG